MKSMFIKSAVRILFLLVIFALFSACGNPQTAVVEVAPESVPDTTVVPTVVTIQADGRYYTFDDATGKSVQQLLDQAGIVLNTGDTISLLPDQRIPGDLIFQVLRQHTVTVTVATADSGEAIRHTAVLMEGTVAEAIGAVGIELAENHVVNFELNKALEDGMQIVVSVGTLPEITTTTEPPVTTVTDTPTEPAPVQSGRTIVSIDVYEDCDGSGHGIKIITYSDGNQEEVMF